MDDGKGCMGANCGSLKTQDPSVGNACVVPSRVHEDSEGCKFLPTYPSSISFSLTSHRDDRAPRNGGHAHVRASIRCAAAAHFAVFLHVARCLFFPHVVCTIQPVALILARLVSGCAELATGSGRFFVWMAGRAVQDCID